MRIAYADPPYIGQARRHYRNDPSGIPPAEVDHAALIAQLEREYQGWALSCSESTLQTILPLCPAGVRVLAWAKPFCSWKSTNPAYAWEPVIVRLPRKANKPAVRSYYLANMTTKTCTHGAKPRDFYYWLFSAMNLRADDSLDDLFPGSGACSRAWEIWRKQAPVSGRCIAQLPRQLKWEKFA